jgi:hypothetical protein
VMVAIGSPTATSIRESAAREVRGASATVAAAAAVRRKSRRVKQPVVTTWSSVLCYSWCRSQTGQRYHGPASGVNVTVKENSDMLRVALSPLRALMMSAGGT